jgi:LMBR1 domain-containing protein 1
LRPIKLLGGVLLVIVVLIIFASMLVTGIDKAKNSICKRQCGYLLAHINIFQPINWVLVKSSKVFPIDYVIFLFIVLIFFGASIVGLATIGIRVFWLTIFRIRKAHTSPQALLMATVMLTLISLALNYSIAMMVAPQYATFGPQTYADHYPELTGDKPKWSARDIIPCTEYADSPAAKKICTPTVASTFLNRVTVNFPFFGVVDFWAQFVFLGIFLLAFVVLLFRVPKLSEVDLEGDAIEEEEEGLLASTGRRFGATWQDITGRAGSKTVQGRGQRDGGMDRD